MVAEHGIGVGVGVGVGVGGGSGSGKKIKGHAKSGSFCGGSQIRYI